MAIGGREERGSPQERVLVTGCNACVEAAIRKAAGIPADPNKPDMSVEELLSLLSTVKQNALPEMHKSLKFYIAAHMSEQLYDKKGEKLKPDSTSAAIAAYGRALQKSLFTTLGDDLTPKDLKALATSMGGIVQMDDRAAEGVKREMGSLIAGEQADRKLQDEQ